MYQHNNDKDNLEQFLQTVADKNKMYSDEKVWNAIYKELHGYKRWNALTIISFIVITVLTVFTILFNNTVKLNFIASNTFKEVKNKVPKKATTALISENIIPQQKIFSQSNKSYNTYPTLAFIEKESLPEAVHSKTNKSISLAFLDKLFLNNYPNLNGYIATTNSIEEPTINSIYNLKHSTLNINANTSLLAALNTVPKQEEQIILPKVIIQENPTTEIEKYISKTAFTKNKKSAIELQVYATPSMSYRKLVDDKTRNTISLRDGNTTTPLPSVYYVDVNEVVHHKPALGLEAGVGILYKLTDKVKLRTGLQFNIRKYYIDSYKSGLNIAQIAVITNNGLDTINQFATSSTTGPLNKSLKNSLYQISIPLGIQWSFLQSKNFEIGLGLSIQPTLTLNKNVYLISTDYKYYTDGTSFFRKWNINT
ncbi:MAG TPA: outer membrane beta-barrel protein, partial [Chitinophagaceae bacterium]|nr:outer membrane beta-barrel protein [Chitinophagaceae bacterium]